MFALGYERLPQQKICGDFVWGGLGQVGKLWGKRWEVVRWL